MAREALGPEQLRLLNFSLVTSSDVADALNQVRVYWGMPEDILVAMEKELTKSADVGIDGSHLWQLANRTKRFVYFLRVVGYDGVLTNTSLVRQLEKNQHHFIHTFQD